ncbi:hypothetical protein CFREI_01150 [Corynebacterium freiburgense]|nr:hypothetical protein CFREI_01150 [Corynebacterium freiburgense]
MLGTMDERSVCEWVPDRRMAFWMNLVGLVLTIAAFFGLMFLYSMNRAQGVSLVFDPVQLVLSVVILFVLSLALVIVHELLHGFAIRTLGHKPKYGALMLGKVLPAFYCTAPGAIFSKAGFIYIALLPAIVLTILPALWIVVDFPGSGWLVLPASFVFGGAIGDFFLVGRTLRTPAGTRVEDLRDGVRFHPALSEGVPGEGANKVN